MPEVTTTPLKGISIRDRFAIEALGFLIQKYESNSIPIPDIVARAYEYASNMLTKANTSGATDTDYNIGKILTEGFAALVEAIGKGGGGGGGTSSFNGKIQNADNTTLAVSGGVTVTPASGSTIGIGNAGLGSSAQNPLFVSGNGGSGTSFDGEIKTASGDSVVIKGDNSYGSGSDAVNDAINVAIVSGGGSGGGTDTIHIGSSTNGRGETSNNPLITKDEALRATSGLSNTLYTELTQLHKDMGYDWQGTGTLGVCTQELRLRDIRSQIYNIAVSQKYVADDQTYGDTNTIAYFLKQIADNTAGGGSTIDRDHVPTATNENVTEFIVFCGSSGITPFKITLARAATVLSGYLDDKYKKANTIVETEFNSSPNSRTILNVSINNTYRMLGTLNGTFEINLPNVDFGSVPDSEHEHKITIFFETVSPLGGGTGIAYLKVSTDSQSTDDIIYQSGYDNTLGWTLNIKSYYRADFTYMPNQGTASNDLWVAEYKQIYTSNS